MIDSVGMSNRYIIPFSNVNQVTPVNTDNTVDSSRKVAPVECQTCKNRRYQDVSDEQVSFKTPGKELVSASVSLKLAVCPECGRSYIAGGTTKTLMRTYNDDPYSRNQKSFEAEAARGNYVDYVA